VPLLLLSSAATAQEAIPCEPDAPSAFKCPGELVCNADRQCVPPPQPTSSRPGEEMRTWGAILTVTGAVLLGTTVFFFSRSNSCGGWGISFAPIDDDCKVGYVTLFPTLAALGVGIPLWAIGQHRMNQEAHRATLYLIPVDGGAVAGVRLVSF
jgi:hypothetical protein